jgi:hypothetical protein
MNTTSVFPLLNRIFLHSVYHDLIYCNVLLISWLSLSLCCGNLKLRYRTPRQFSRKEHFILLAQTRDSCPKAEPQEQRSLILYALASRLQKQKRSNPYMVTMQFYRLFHPNVMWPSTHLEILSFISLPRHPFLPATLSECRPISSLVLLPATSFPPFDAWTYLGWKSIILF